MATRSQSKSFPDPRARRPEDYDGKSSVSYQALEQGSGWLTRLNFLPFLVAGLASTWAGYSAFYAPSKSDGALQAKIELLELKVVAAEKELATSQTALAAVQGDKDVLCGEWPEAKDASDRLKNLCLDAAMKGNALCRNPPKVNWAAGKSVCGLN